MSGKNSNNDDCNTAGAALDPRVNAFRPDLADASLGSMVVAGRYVEPRLMQCVRGVVPLLSAPAEGAARISEIRYGEILDVFEERDDGFAWVQNRSDRYVGYIKSDNVLSEGVPSFSHRINMLHTHVYAEPDLKSRIVDQLTLGSYLDIMDEKDGFSHLASGGYVFAKHMLAAEDAMDFDYVYTAGRMLNVPYLWGGRTPLGLDCSALVQLSLDMAGIECMRDSDEQREAFGRALPIHWRDYPWRRGELVFFPGHVGIMTDHNRIIHANAFAMKVTVEPLVDLVLRGNEIIAVGNPG
ncbi:MAG: NlpC/P60 family protein [Alphaproteobacteria bacterium]|nr:NlpC/P60 family protein [Alphaproteobacteria bacterium]